MASPPLDLRWGDARDIAVIDALMAAAFDPRFGEAWTRGQCLGVLAMPGVRLTLASREGRAAGFALVRGVLDEAELLLIAVAPGQRGRGIGGALLRSVEADALAAGMVTLHLEVRSGNNAVRLYTAQGFAKVGERRGYYRGEGGEIHDAHSYAKRLA